MRALVLILAASLFALQARAGVSDKAYERAVDYIERLYLYPDQVDAPALLHSAARGLADEVDWLLVDVEGNAVHLRHGSGAAIGSVSVASLETLPVALMSLETLVIEAGYSLGDIDPRLELLRGMTYALDRHSRILSGDRLERFDVRLKGTLVGIGASLKIIDGRVTVTEVFKEGPAALNGVTVGDVIVRIDGVSTVNMPLAEATRRIKGDIDTAVALSFDRAGKAFDLTLTRAEVIVANVKHEVLPGGVGYIEITHFSQRTVQNLVGALDELRALGALDKGLIIDLRGNTGGSMKEAANSADLFLKGGMLLRTAGPDGGQVQNLQARMDASDQETEPPVPIVVLMDQRTASGSEILAGALLELDRAVLIGSRSYGKGTVQKIYNLDDETRFKLTVAEYLLENDRSIASIGLTPDAALATIDLDEHGVRYRGWGPRAAGRPWEEIIPIVYEHHGWRESASYPEGDVAQELARRTVLAATGWDRGAVLEALALEAPKLRGEQEARFAEALGGHDIDWSLPEACPEGAVCGAPPAGPAAEVRIKARPDPDHGDVVIIAAEVDNRSGAPLHRALVELSCDTLSVWAGVVVPVGLVAPGEIARGEVRVVLPPGISPREDIVLVRLRSAGQEPTAAGEEVLAARSVPMPHVSVSASLEGDSAHIELTNLSRYALDDLEVFFEAPGDIDVELVDATAELVHVEAGATASLRLQLRMDSAAPEVLPLHLVIRSDRFGRIEEWPVSLDRVGTAVKLESPVVRIGEHPLSATVGRYPVSLTVADDRAIDHVVLYANGRKVAWIPGGSPSVHLDADIDLEVGANRLVAVAVDDQGLEQQLTFSVRGELEAAVDANEPP